MPAISEHNRRGTSDSVQVVNMFQRYLSVNVLTTIFVLNGQMQTKQANYYIPAVLSSLLLIAFALCVFPIPGTDSLVFLPAAVSYARGQGFVNPLYYVADFTDATHTHRFNYYVPFFPWLMGIVGRVYADVRTIFLFCALLGSTGLLLYSRVVIMSVIGADRYIRWGFVLSCFYLPLFFLPTVARPENLTFFISFIVYLLYNSRLRLSRVGYVIALSALLAALLASQILSFIFCFVFLALCDLLDTNKPLRSALHSFVVLVLSVGMACLLIAAGPIGLIETVTAFWWHVTMVVGRHDNSISLLIHYWALAPLSFGFVGVFIFATGFFLRHMWTSLTNAGWITRFFAFVLVAFLLWTFNKYVLYGAPTVYNVTQFILPMMAFVTMSVAVYSQRFISVSYLILCFLGTLAMGRHLVMFGNMLVSGKTFGKARNLIEEKTGDNGRRLVSNGLWSVCNDINSPVTILLDKYKSGDTVVVQQAYMDVPDDLKQKADLLFDWRAPAPVSLLGIKVASRPQGYGFSIYHVR